MTPPVVSLRDLKVTFAGGVRAVDGVSLDLERGEVVALIGESGSGKSVTLRSVLRLNPERRTTVEGSIAADGGDVETTLAQFESAGVDVDALAATLQSEGARNFVKSWDDLLRRIDAQVAAVA